MQINPPCFLPGALPNSKQTYPLQLLSETQLGFQVRMF